MTTEFCEERSRMTDAFGFGIEEEYFLADATTCESPHADAADAFHEAAARAVESASHELLKGQIEVQTEPETDLDRACDRLRAMRQKLSEIAARHGLLLIAAGTHPLALKERQRVSETERYRRLAEDFGIIIERALFCAMHIHVEPPAPENRIDVMNRMLPFLPLFLALSASSPFWQGRPAGVMAHRLTAFSEWPRMGLPEVFDSEADYDEFVGALVAAGAIEDASFLWWHIRPSAHFPTIELRICDSCTRVEDSVAIAALYRALTRCVARRPEFNRPVGALDRGVCLENIWQIQKRGLAATLIDGRGGPAVSVAVRLEQALELAAEDADALGSSDWVGRTRDIVRDGASADRQLAVWRAAKAAGAGDAAALREVVRMLARETVL